MDGDCISGQIRQDTKDFDKMIKRMEKGHFITSMEMSLKGIGLRIKRVGMEFIRILMAQSMRENGRMICKMGMELRLGLMGRNLKGIILPGRKMEEVS